jgi:hypothetical protein
VSTVWLVVVIVGVATVGLKATGPVLARRRKLPDAVAWSTCSRPCCSPRLSSPGRWAATTSSWSTRAWGASGPEPLPAVVIVAAAATALARVLY